MDFETENIEFKSEFTEEIYKEVIAFANTEGGTLYQRTSENTPTSIGGEMNRETGPFIPIY